MSANQNRVIRKKAAKFIIVNGETAILKKKCGEKIRYNCRLSN